jgi:hypothetical protein
VLRFGNDPCETKEEPLETRYEGGEGGLGATGSGWSGLRDRDAVRLETVPMYLMYLLVARHLLIAAALLTWIANGKG